MDAWLTDTTRIRSFSVSGLHIEQVPFSLNANFGVVD